MPKIINLIGQKFGRLEVVSKDGSKQGRVYWNCRCECGNDTTASTTQLKSGNTKSCGCLRSESMSESSRTHGLSKTRFYRIWINMKRRCYDEKDNQYHNYGGRGIKVSEEWLTFENFMNDMYNSYIEFEKEHGKNSASLDRLDSDKDYNKDNCRWATDLEQARNRKDNISVVVDGVEYATLSELAEAYNISKILVWSRYRSGNRGKELVAPKRHNGKNHKGHNNIKVEVNGKTYNSLTELQKDYSYISLVSISKRYKQGKRGEDLIVRRQKTKRDSGEDNNSN